MSFHDHHNPPVRRIGQHVHDYATARNFLGHREKRKLANNTLIAHLGQGHIGVKLHRTWIVIYYPDGNIELNSGGYQTVTTKQRMNELLPPWLGVVQRRGDWFLHNTITGQSVPFHDGEVVDGVRPDTALPGESRTNPPGAQVRRNPGRFSSKLDEWVYILSLDGPDEELGDVGGFGYYALLENIEAEDVLRAAESVGDDEQDVRKFYLHELRGVAGGQLRDAGDFAAIVHVDNDGFVYVDYCRVGRDVRDTWQAIERDYEEYEQSEEEDA